MNTYRITLRNSRGNTETKIVKADSEQEAVSKARMMYDGRVICADRIN